MKGPCGARPALTRPVSCSCSDVVSYTRLASDLAPIQVVTLLNEVYSLIDSIVDQHPDIYKLETIGDAYVAVAGCPKRMGAEAAASAMARFALEVVSTIDGFTSVDGHQIQIRVGIHSGPVVAAIIGSKMPRYCERRHVGWPCEYFAVIRPVWMRLQACLATR